MADFETMFGEITKRRKELAKVKSYATTLPMERIEAYANVRLDTYTVRLAFEAKDYNSLLRLFKLLKDKVRMSTANKSVFFYSAEAHFYWDAPLIRIRFSCPDDQIPPSLMPSETCHIEEYEETTKEKRMVCDVK